MVKPMLNLEVALGQAAVMAPNQSPFADGTRARTQGNLGQHNSATLRIAYMAPRPKLSQLESERWVGQHPNAPSQYFRFQIRRGTKAKFALTMMLELAWLCCHKGCLCSKLTKCGHSSQCNEIDMDIYAITTVVFPCEWRRPLVPTGGISLGHLAI